MHANVLVERKYTYLLTYLLTFPNNLKLQASQVRWRSTNTTWTRQDINQDHGLEDKNN